MIQFIIDGLIRDTKLVCLRLIGSMGFQAFLAENLLCALEPLILLSFRY